MAALLCAAAQAGAQAAGTPEQADSPLRISATVSAPDAQRLPPVESWAGIRINDVPLDDPALIYRDEAGELYARPQDLMSWNIPLPEPDAVVTVLHRGERLQRIAARPGFLARFDEDSAMLDLRVDPWLLPAQRGAARGAELAPTAGPLALYANYQAYALAGRSDSLSGLVELGASRGRGSADSTWVLGAGHGSPRRLMSSLRLDMPARRERLEIGDAISLAAPGGHGWRFAGLRWATDFDLAPQLPAYALPAAHGVAEVPSTIDLFVNGALVGSRGVAAGPFEIPDVPVPTGAGTVMLRVRDVLGREQFIEQRFLTSPSLLPRGITAHAVEVGAMRQGYGERDFQYGRAFVAASLRHGQFEGLTWEGSLAGSRGHAALRMGTAARLGMHLTGEWGATVGRRHGVTGHALDVALDWQSDRLSLSMHGRRGDAATTDLASSPAPGRATQEWSAQVSPRLRFAGSAGLAYTRRRAQGSPAVAVTSAFVSFAHVAGGSLLLQVSRVDAARRSMQASASYVRRLGGRYGSSATLQQDARGTGTAWQVARNAPLAQGWGWQASARTGAMPQQALRLNTRSQRGFGELDVTRGAQGLEGGAAWRGGLLWAERTLHVTAPLTSAVALIETPGVPGARVLQDGQDLGHTDHRGHLVATALRAYEPNELRLDAGALPVGAWVEQDRLSVVPYARGVVHVRFDTEAAARTLTLRQADGRFVPAGARVHTGGNHYPVGEDGRVSLPLPAGWQVLRVSWDDHGCESRIDGASAASWVDCREATP